MFILGVATQCRHRGLNNFRKFSLILYFCCRIVVVAKLKNCRMPSSASFPIMPQSRATNTPPLCPSPVLRIRVKLIWIIRIISIQISVCVIILSIIRVGSGQKLSWIRQTVLISGSATLAQNWMY